MLPSKFVSSAFTAHEGGGARMKAKEPPASFDKQLKDGVVTESIWRELSKVISLRHGGSRTSKGHGCAPKG